MNKTGWNIIQGVCVLAFIGSVFMCFYWYGYRLNSEWIIKKETLPLKDPFLYVLLFVIGSTLVVFPFAEFAVRNECKVQGKVLAQTLFIIGFILGMIYLFRFLGTFNNFL